MDTKFITATEIGKDFRLNCRQVMIAILNKTMDIPGAVVIPAEDKNHKWVCRVLRASYQKWKEKIV